VWVNANDNLRVAPRQILETAIKHNDHKEPTVLITISEIEERKQAQPPKDNTSRGDRFP